MMKVKEVIGSAIIGTILIILFIVVLIALIIFEGWFRENVDPLFIIGLVMVIFIGVILAACAIVVIGYAYWAGNEIYKEMFGKESEE